MDKDNELTLRKALFYTNAAYIFADIANTAILDSESELKKIGQFISEDQKRKFSYAKNQIKKAKEITEKIAKPIYKISDADSACSDSDYLYELLKLVIDRTSDTDESKKEMLEYLMQKPSVMNIYEFIKQDIL